MTRKSITTSHRVVACDVCGRTLLRGEKADVFLHGGTRKMVCELCTARAMHEGWIREGLDDVHAGQRDRDRGGRGLLGRLRARRETSGAERGESYPLAPEPEGRAAPLDDPAVHEPAPEPPPAP